MRTTKKTWQNVLYVCILLAAVFLVFRWYSITNSRRIERQNLNYAMDSANQTAQRIESEFKSALLRLHNYAYLLGNGKERPEITAGLLKGMEESASFDAICFTDAEGVTLSSDGETNDCSDRAYYAGGMRGESGLEVVQSRLTGRTVTVFYAPIQYGGETVGMLLGLYLAEDYLRDMLTTSYFGEQADAFLCMPDGKVIASSRESAPDQLLPDMLLEDGSIDPATSQILWGTFRGGEEKAGLTCGSGCRLDNLCVFHILGGDYRLVQTFPQSVTQFMIREANHAGMVLQVLLIGLFAVYILVLLVRAYAQRKTLEKQNTQFGYVLDGLNTLFSSRYLTVDLEHNAYSYMAGIRPLSSSLAMEGSYDDIIRIHAQDIVESEGREQFRRTFRVGSISDILSDQDTFTYECHVSRNGKEDWEHLIAVCLQRKEGRPTRALYVRQNITELKLRELQSQKALSVMNRKERQYRIAITSTAFCTFEWNLTRDLIEHDVTCLVDGRQVSLLEKIGLSAPVPPPPVLRDGRPSSWRSPWRSTARRSTWSG